MYVMSNNTKIQKTSKNDCLNTKKDLVVAPTKSIKICIKILQLDYTKIIKKNQIFSVLIKGTLNDG